MIDSILGNGLAGIKRGLESAGRNAQEISNALTDVGSGDVITPLTGLKLDSLQVQASASVVRIADEMQQSVLDILA